MGCLPGVVVGVVLVLLCSAPGVTAAQDSNEMDNAVQWQAGVWIEVVINEIGILADGKM